MIRALLSGLRPMAVLVLLALCGCAQVATGRGQAPNVPYSSRDSGNTNDRGGDGVNVVSLHPESRCARRRIRTSGTGCLDDTRHPALQARCRWLIKAGCCSLSLLKFAELCSRHSLDMMPCEVGRRNIDNDKA